MSGHVRVTSDFVMGGGGFEAEQESAFYLSKYERLVIQIDCDESIYRALPACRPKLR